MLHFTQEKPRIALPTTFMGIMKIYISVMFVQEIGALWRIVTTKYKGCYYPPKPSQLFATFLLKRKLYLPKAFHYHLNCLFDINLET